MSVRLLVRQRSEAGGDKPSELVLDDEVITLGRDKASQVVLSQQAVSRNHARISRDGSLFFLEDLGSAYGTQINGKALPKGEKRLLRNGDVIGIAQFDVTFDRAVERPQVGSDKTSLVARSLVKDVMRGLGSGEGPFFRVMNGPREGEKIEVTDAREIIIGREDGVADLVLKDDLISRKHAKIRRDWSGTHVEDLDSRNGIRVNKKRVNRKTLKDRDELEVGGIRLLYLDPTEVREAPVVLPNEEPPKEVEGESTNGGLAEEKPEPVPEPEPEPAPEPEPPEIPAEEPEAEPEPEPDGEDYPAQEMDAEPPPAGLLGLGRNGLIVMVALAVVGLAAIGLIVAVIAGA